MRETRNRKVVPMRRLRSINFGAGAFIIIFIYLVVCCIMYFNKPRISIYEVEEKKLSDEYSCTGIVLRDETLINTESSGYLNYYYAEGSKIGKNEVVYTVDETGELYNLLRTSNEKMSLSKSERALLWDNISEFRNGYDSSEYSTVSDFTYNVENTVLELSSSTMSHNIDNILKENNISGSYRKISSDRSGIIAYTQDGYEGKKAKDITTEDFHGNDYEKKMLRSQDKVEVGEPAYKMVTGEDWTLVIELTENLYQQLETRRKEDKKKKQEYSYLNISFSKEGIELKKPYTLSKGNKGYFAIIEMSDYIVHFLDDRFVNVDISLDSMEGLKIPTTSIVKKECFVVPEEYFTKGGDGEKTGLIKESYDKSGEVSYKFVECSGYTVDEDGMVYIDQSLFSKGEWIRNETNQERYQIAKTGKLEGVYNVNLGYIVFDYIEVLYWNEEYCIVKPNTENGLSNYDHIVVDSATVNEDDMLNKYKGE